LARAAVANKRTHVRPRLDCQVIGVRKAFPIRRASFRFPAKPIWTVDGPLGSLPLQPRVLDLLDLAGAIYRVESQIPGRRTNPVVEWRIAAAVRDPGYWSSTGGPLLASVLEFLSRARWSFTFSPRERAPEIVSAPAGTRSIRQIVLFSGGMDSACGLGVHSGRKDQVQLVSFYTRQRALQRSLSEELAFGVPVQWRLIGARGSEGMNLIRSFMFLSLGAVVADTFGVTELFQYENGFLALAIPPSGSFVPTRHAHPELHRRMERLFETVLRRPVKITNPFADLTKREIALRFRDAAGEKAAEAVLRRTETCWRLFQAHVGGKPKRPGVPCGVCTPCIVRLTARPQEAAAGAWPGWRGCSYDLTKRAVREHPKLGLTFRAYLELVDIALATRDDHVLIADLPPEARALIGGETAPSVTEAAALLRRFAREFCKAFGIARRKMGS
jgi:7-cyano-7-deazaguanine synthase in queuosine biosynthesis